MAGEVRGFDVGQYLNPKEARRMDLFIQYGMAAGIQAIRDSGIEVTEANAERIGINIVPGSAALPLIEETHQLVLNRGPARFRPSSFRAHHQHDFRDLSIQFGIKGPNLAVVTACASGLHAVGQSARMIMHGDVDLMVAGGRRERFARSESRFCRCARPVDAQRRSCHRQPSLDKDRDGFVLGEGSGVLVLEEYEHARARGARSTPKSWASHER